MKADANQVSPKGSTSGWGIRTALLFFAAVAAYFPALGAGFIWDDSGHVTRADLRSFHGLVRIWTEVGATQQYYPVLHTAFWIEHKLWADSAFGYHLLNVLLHATAACLFAVALSRVLGIPSARPPNDPADAGQNRGVSASRKNLRVAWIAAALFALHPVCVESVAWISEQKNTLSTFFYLCAALAYLRFDRQRTARTYWVASVFFVLALLSKSVTATLPAALLVVLWWRRGRIDFRRDVGPLAPWFGLGAAAGLLSAWVERAYIGAQGAGYALTALQRLLLAGRVAWFYLGKWAWPAKLVFIYPRWAIDPARGVAYLFPLGWLALTAALCFVAWRRGLRGPLAALLFFSGSLFPVLGFVNVFPFVYSYVADHFQYLASLGLCAAAALGWEAFADRASRGTRRLSSSRFLAAAPPVAVCCVLGVLTSRQTRMYHDVFVLYRTTLERNPACWMAEDNLGSALADAGKASEAVPHFMRALELKPDFPEIENNLGDVLNQLGRSREAEPYLRKAVAVQPAFSEAHNNLGVSCMLTGRPAEGIAEFEKAVHLKPGYFMAHYNLAIALHSAGRVAEANREYAEAMSLKTRAEGVAR